MYTISSWGRVFKIDVRNPQAADLLWISDPEIEHEGNDPQTRGIALYGTNIINPLRDGRLVGRTATAARSSGTSRWRSTTEYGGQERFNAAPLCIEDKCMVSNATGDGGTRGWLAAADPDDRRRTLAHLRRSGPGRARLRDLAGHRTDRLDPWRRRHVDNRLVRSGEPQRRSGAPATRSRATIPSSVPATTSSPTSTIAFDIDTGKMKWYFQLTPNDGWDYDENGVNFVFDAPVDGQMTHQIGHFGRNGFYYNWNALDGRLHQRQSVGQRGDLDQGSGSQDRQAARVRSHPGRADLHPGDPRPA